MKGFWQGSIAAALAAVICLSGCTKPAEPSSEAMASFSESSSQVSETSSEEKESSSAPEQSTSSESTVSDREVRAEVGSTAEGDIPTASELAEQAQSEQDKPEVKMYKVDGSARRELEETPMPVSLILDDEPLNVKMTPIKNKTFEGKTSGYAAKNGPLKVFDISFVQPSKTVMNRMQIEVVVEDLMQVVMETPCLDRTVNDSVLVMTAGNRLVIPTSEHGILVYGADMFESGFSHLSTVLTVPGDSHEPHRLIGFQYDEEMGRFLVLHTKNVDKTAEGGAAAPANMILTVYDGRWQPLAVYDTGLLPDMETASDFPRRYTFGMVESGLAYVGGSRLDDKQIISYS